MKNIWVMIKGQFSIRVKATTKYAGMYMCMLFVTSTVGFIIQNILLFILKHYTNRSYIVGNPKKASKVSYF